jgi:hypothetical protein
MLAHHDLLRPENEFGFQAVDSSARLPWHMGCDVRHRNRPDVGQSQTESQMNQQGRRKAKVMEHRTLRPDQIIQRICAWDGCQACCDVEGAIPRGWVNLITFRSSHPVASTFAATSHGGIAIEIRPDDDWQRDAVLCPAHARALESHLKDLGRTLTKAKPMANA